MYYQSYCRHWPHPWYDRQRNGRPTGHNNYRFPNQTWWNLGPASSTAHIFLPFHAYFYSVILLEAFEDNHKMNMDIPMRSTHLSLPREWACAVSDPSGCSLVLCGPGHMFVNHFPSVFHFGQLSLSSLHMDQYTILISLASNFLKVSDMIQD